jgi:hypothetical protein
MTPVSPTAFPPEAAVAHAADCTVATAVKTLLPVLGSGGVPESVMVAVLGYSPATLAVTTTETVAVAPLFRGVGSVQLIGPVPTQVVPALGVTETRVKPAGANVSVSVTAFAGDRPLLVTVVLYVVFCPTKTALTTLVVTAMSAVVGLIETAPSDQFEELLKVSEIGTLGAPDLVLPVPRTSGGETGTAKVSFHRET